MGAVDNIMGDVGGWFGEDLVGGLTGQTAADASLAAAQLQRDSAVDALNYQKEKDALARSDLQPFVGNGKDLLGMYKLMLDPRAQANYLTANPMFQAAIEKSNTGLKNTYGFSGKRGDLQNAITQNYMATGQNYVNNALNNLWNPITLSQASAAGQALGAQNAGAQGSDLITGAGNAGAAGIVGAANAQQAGMANLAQIGGGILGAFLSDRRLKKHVTRIGSHGPYNVYAWQYRGGNDDIYIGVMADEVKQINPAAVVNIDGFDAVLYGAL
jgi:hypothetical protein